MTVEQPVNFKQLDQILQLLGDPGRFQIIQFIVLSFTYVPMAINDFVVIFYGLPPTSVRCYGEVSEEAHLFLNRTNATTDAVAPLYTRNMTEEVCHCPHGFKYTYPGRQWSIIGDMNLICDRSSLVNLASVLYFLGQVVSTPFAGWAADKYGRRPTLLVSYALYAALETSLVFSRDYISFVLLRFSVGVARQTMNSAFFVLMMEWIPPSRRGIWGAISEFQYTIGVLLITLVGFLLQNWIHIQAFIAALCLFAIPLYWFAPESLSWLCLKYRSEEAVKTCQFVATFNGIILSDATVSKIRTFSQKQSTQEDQRMYTFADCFRSPNVRKTTFLCLICWFACYFGYLGISYLSSEIAADVYLNLAINGLLELIPIALATVVASKLGNRLPLATYFLTGGIFAVIAGVIPGSSHGEIIAQNIVAFISRLAFVGTCCVIFVYTTELFPTVIRNNAFSLCSTNLRIGCMITPLLPLMAAKTSFKGSGFIFVGIVAIIAAIAAWLLRETKGQPLPRTIDEVEKLAHGDMIGFLQLRLQTVKFNFRVRPPQHSGLRAKSVVELEAEAAVAARA